LKVKRSLQPQEIERGGFAKERPKASHTGKSEKMVR